MSEYVGMPVPTQFGPTNKLHTMHLSIDEYSSGEYPYAYSTQSAAIRGYCASADGFVVEARVKPDSLTGTQCIMAAYAGSTDGWYVRLVDGKPSITFAGVGTVTCPTAIPADEAVNFAVGWNGSTSKQVRVWINRTLVHTDTLNPGDASVGVDGVVMMCAKATGGSEQYFGDVDYIRIWDGSSGYLAQSAETINTPNSSAAHQWYLDGLSMWNLDHCGWDLGGTAYRWEDTALLCLSSSPLHTIQDTGNSDYPAELYIYGPKDSWTFLDASDRFWPYGYRGSVRVQTVYYPHWHVGWVSSDGSSTGYWYGLEGGAFADKANTPGSNTTSMSSDVPSSMRVYNVRLDWVADADLYGGYDINTPPAQSLPECCIVINGKVACRFYPDELDDFWTWDGTRWRSFFYYHTFNLGVTGNPRSLTIAAYVGPLVIENDVLISHEDKYFYFAGPDAPTHPYIEKVDITMYELPNYRPLEGDDTVIGKKYDPNGITVAFDIWDKNNPLTRLTGATGYARIICGDYDRVTHAWTWANPVATTNQIAESGTTGSYNLLLTQAEINHDQVRVLPPSGVNGVCGGVTVQLFDHSIDDVYSNVSNQANTIITDIADTYNNVSNQASAIITDIADIQSLLDNWNTNGAPIGWIEGAVIRTVHVRDDSAEHNPVHGAYVWFTSTSDPTSTIVGSGHGVTDILGNVTVGCGLAAGATCYAWIMAPGYTLGTPYPVVVSANTLVLEMSLAPAVGAGLDDTLAGLLRMLQIRLNDLDVGAYAIEELLYCINLAKAETELATRCHKERLEVDLLAGTHTYDVSPIFEPISITIAGVTVNKRQIGGMAISLESWDSTPPGTPTDWLQITGSSIRVNPTPKDPAKMIVQGFSTTADMLIESDRPVSIPGRYRIPAILDRAEAEASNMRRTASANAVVYPLLMESWKGWCGRIVDSLKGIL